MVETDKFNFNDLKTIPNILSVSRLVLIPVMLIPCFLIGDETLARKIADLLQQFTQFGGVRPFGVSLIFCGVDRTGSHIWKTDPSGNYVAFNAIAIGSGSEKVIELLEKQYKEDISFDNAAILALESIFTSSDQPTNIENIKMSIIDSETHTMKNLSDDELANYAKKVNTGKRKPEN